MGARVVPETVLKELHQLWVSLGETEAQADGLEVLRSCTMTLIVVTAGASDAALEETLAELMQAHPSRAILLRLGEGAEPRLDSTVRAQCWRPFGTRQQVCCELIDIHFTRPRLEGVVNLLKGVLAPDLPVVLWLRGGLMPEVPELAGLLPVASRVIVDSREAACAREALEAIGRLRDAGKRVADLAWTRLTPWRKMVAGLFDSAGCRARMKAVDRVVIEHRGERAPSTAVYLGAWLAEGLGGRAAVELRPAPADEFPQGTIHAVWLRAPEFEIALRVVGTTPETRQIELRAGGLHSYVVLPSRRVSALIAEELSIDGTDVQFQKALRAAIAIDGGAG